MEKLIYLVWGDDGTRVIASEKYWQGPIKWDERASEAGERHRVFCASLADVFEDRPELVEPREQLFTLIAETPNIDWLLLTKRPENAHGYRAECALPEEWPLANVWLGVSVEDQARADERIPILLDTPAAARFVSYEPALGPVIFEDRWLGGPIRRMTGMGWDPHIGWVIVGGESGHGARPFDIQWARDTITQCQTAGVPVFVKQLGACPIERHRTGGKFNGRTSLYEFTSRKGGDPDEWPDDLRIREYPTPPNRNGRNVLSTATAPQLTLPGFEGQDIARAELKLSGTILLSTSNHDHLRIANLVRLGAEVELVVRVTDDEGFPYELPLTAKVSAKNHKIKSDAAGSPRAGSCAVITVDGVRGLTAPQESHDLPMLGSWLELRVK